MSIGTVRKPDEEPARKESTARRFYEDLSPEEKETLRRWFKTLDILGTVQ
jgi:hypothetical protein